MLSTFLSKLVAGNLKRSRAERRAARRLVPTQPTPCLLKLPGQANGDPAWIQNLSLRGAGLQAVREHAPGTTLQLLLVNAAHMYALPVEFTVVRCVHLSDGTFFLGGRFTSALPPDALLPFFV